MNVVTDHKEMGTDEEVVLCLSSKSYFKTW